MRLPLLAVYNGMGRGRIRTLLTVLGAGVTVLSFVALRTIIISWNAAADHAVKERIGTRHKITFVMRLPLHYFDVLRATPGIKAATYADWFGARDPRHENEFFGQFAVDTDTFFVVYRDFDVPPDQFAAWREDRQGAIVGDVLAQKLGWKIGDKVTLRGTIYPGDWVFYIRGIYQAKSKVVDRSSFIFHWKYLNEGAIETAKDHIGWMVSLIDDPKNSAAISAAIDRQFSEREHQTVTMSERDMNVSMMGMFSSVLHAIDIVSLVILAILTLILGNTIAMGVRERTHEYAVLRAIGFRAIHVCGFVLGEGLVIGLTGGILGIILSVLIVQMSLGPFLEQEFGAFFPHFRLAPSSVIVGLIASSALGVVASIIPATRIVRMRVTDALRMVG